MKDKNTIIKKVLHYILKNKIFTDSDTILLAVSGGVDSVVLFNIIIELGYKCVVAHCNFGLRGEESDADEIFVRELSEQHSIKFVSQKFIITDHKSNSIQMEARDIRYKWFKDILTQQKCTKIATAHHFSDCVETLLLNLARGTSLDGLSNIFKTKNFLCRPILCLNKEEILSYAKNNKLIWREDSSNIKTDYRRNFIRHKIMPLFKEINPSFLETTERSLNRIEQTNLLWKSFIKNYLKKNKREDRHGDIILNIKNVHNTKWGREALHAMTKKYGFLYSQIDQFLQSNDRTGKQISSIEYILYEDRLRWIIKKKENSDYVQVLKNNIKTEVLDKGFCILGYSNDVGYFDFALIKMPIYKRFWEPGDRFIPFGMKNYKKISDFLIDMKVPIYQKNKVEVLVSDNTIIWVIGYRIDDRFKVTSETKKVLKVQLLLDQLI